MFIFSQYLIDCQKCQNLKLGKLTKTSISKKVIKVNLMSVTWPLNIWLLIYNKTALPQNISQQNRIHNKIHFKAYSRK